MSGYNLKSYNLKGQVKTVREFVYKPILRNGNLELSTRISASLNFGEDCYFFNESGNLTENRVYDLNQKLINQYICHYDSAGNLIEYIMYNKGGILFRTKYLFSKENKLLGHKDWYGDTHYSTTLYFTDERGKCDVHENYDPDGCLQGTTQYLLNSKGNIRSCQRRTADDRVIDRVEYYYDDKDNLKERVFLKLDRLYKLVERFDSRKNKVEVISYTSKEKIKSHEKYDHVYDKTGNWIRKIQYKVSTPVSIFERSIEYYSI